MGAVGVALVAVGFVVAIASLLGGMLLRFTSCGRTSCGTCLRHKRVMPVKGLKRGSLIWWLDTLSLNVVKVFLGRTWGEAIAFGVPTLCAIAQVFANYAEDGMSSSFSTQQGSFAAVGFGVLLFPVSRHSYLLGLTGMTYERGIMLHRIAGRVVLFPACAHMWVEIERLNTHVFSMDEHGEHGAVPLTGLVATVAAICIGLTAIEPIRRKVFEVFYILHIVLAVIVYGVGALHDGSVLTWSLVSGGLWIVDLLYRLIARCGPPVEVVKAETLPGDAVKLVLTGRKLPGHPGAFVFMTIPGVSGWQDHPFSLADSTGMTSECLLPISNKYTGSGPAPTFTIVIKSPSPGSWCHKLIEAVDRHQKTGAALPPIHVAGPYGSPTVPVENRKRVILVSGGVGVTPMLAIALDMFRFPAKYEAHKITFIWSSRDEHGWKSWFPSEMQALATDARFDVFLYNTRTKGLVKVEVRSGGLVVVEMANIMTPTPGPGADAGPGRGSTVNPDEAKVGAPEDPAEAKTEAPAEEPATGPAAAPATSARDGVRAIPDAPFAAHARVFPGRPDVDDLIAKGGAGVAAKDVGVYVCGPSSLVESTHFAAWKLGFPCHSETFAM